MAQTLWLLTRSEGLTATMHRPLQIALDALLHGQHSEGWWPSEYHGDRPTDFFPSVTGTALAVLAARRITDDNAQREKCQRAVRWLIAAQAPDGHWQATIGIPRESGPGVDATALALRAVATSGLTDIEDACERGSEWLLSQQSKTGLWHGSGPGAMTTLVALEALRSVRAPRVPLPEGLAAGVDLLRRATFLSHESSETSLQLAVIAAYTGVEAALYGLLESEVIDHATTQPDGRTIGLDKALVAFENALVASGDLKAGKHLPGTSPLRNFTHLRDGVVHHGTRPSSKDCIGATSAATKFVRAQTLRLFGVDPWVDR